MEDDGKHREKEKEVHQKCEQIPRTWISEKQADPLCQVRDYVV